MSEIYYDAKHPAGFGSVKKLAEYSGLPIDRVKRWLSQQRAYTLHKPRRVRGYPTRRYHAASIDNYWQVDLADMSVYSAYNDNIKYLLVCVDVFSKYAFVRPLRGKSAAEVVEQMRDIFERSGRSPLYVNGDAGKEFVNPIFRSLMKEYSAKYFISYGHVKAAIAERFVRTLKEKIGRYLERTNGYRYVDQLQNFVKAYNRSIHSTIGEAPASVDPENAEDLHRIWAQNFRVIPANLNGIVRMPKFLVGDIVRVSVGPGNPFIKGYRGTWMPDYYVVDKVQSFERPYKYKLKNFEGDEKVLGAFYEEEMELVRFSPDQPEHQRFLVEKVIRTKKLNGREYSFVKFAGYPPSSNMWLLSSEIEHV